MEPFRLELTQINFESTDLPYVVKEKELDSFGTVVSFNEDFQTRSDHEEDVEAEMYHTESDPSTGLFKDTLRTKFAEVQDGTHNGFQPSVNQGIRPPVVGAAGDVAPMPSVHTIGRSQISPPLPPAQSHTEQTSAEVNSLLRLAATNLAISQKTHEDQQMEPSHEPGRAPPEPFIHGLPLHFRYPPLGAPSKDSFEAFTKTIEALALQRSVITNPNVAPAPTEAIAEALAKGAEKCQVEANPVPADPPPANIPTSFSKGEAPNSTAGQSEFSDAHSYVDDNPLISMTQNDYSDVESVKHDHSHDTADVSDKQSKYSYSSSDVTTQSSSEYSSDTVTSYQNENNAPVENIMHDSVSDSGKPDVYSSRGGEERNLPMQQELIRIRPESVITTKTKGKTLWLFGGRSEGQDNTAPPTNPSVSSTPAYRSENNTHSVTEHSQNSAVPETSGQKSQTENFQVPQEVPHSSEMHSNNVNMSRITHQTHNNSNMNNNRISETHHHHHDHHNIAAEVSSENPDSRINVAQTAASANIAAQLQDLPAERWLAPPRYQTTEELPSAPETPTHILPMAGRGQAVFDWSAVPLQADGPIRSASGYSTPLSNLSRSSSFANLMGIETNMELEKVLREKAKMEGQVEILEADKKSMTKERLELQNQIATITSQLQVQKNSTLSVAADRDALAVDIETLRQNRNRLEQVIVDTQKLIEDRVAEIRSLEEDLDASQTAVEKLQDKLKLAREDISGKDMTVSALKAQVSELYVEVQNSVQSKIHADLEVKSMKDEIATLVTTREWYQQQLKSVQESRNKLQGEVSKIQAASVAQAATVERLKVENTKIRHQLVDTQQAALKEKELIARHLEGIEMEMLERETAYQQIQTDRLSVEETLHTQIQRVEEEKLRLSSMARTSEDFEEELQKLKNEVRVKTAHISVLEHEQAEMMKRLAMSQECMKDRDQSLETLEQRYVETETNYAGLQTEVSLKNDEIRQLKEEKCCLEVAVESAKSEKQRFDEALLSLKDDMRKVEKSFKQIRNEVEVKTKEVEYLELEKAKISAELEECKQRLRDEPHMTEADAAAMTDFVAEYKEERQKLINEISSLQRDLSIAQEQNSSLHMDKKELEEQASAYRRDIAILQTQVESIHGEKLALQSEIENMEEDVRNVMQIKDEHSTLKDKLKELQSISHKELAKQKGKVVKLSTDVNRLERLLKEKTEAYEHMQAEYTELQRLAEDHRDRMERQVQSVEDRFRHDVDEQMNHIQAELQLKMRELDGMRQEKEDLEKQMRTMKKTSDTEILKCRGRAAKLDKEVKKLKDYIEQTRKSAEANRKMSLELEREKGRLAGVVQNHATLKEHTEGIEEELAKKEFYIIRLEGNMKTETERRDKVESELQGHMQELEKSVLKEKQNVKDAKKQLMTEKGNHIKLKRELQAVLNDMKQLQAENEEMNKQIQVLRHGSEANHQSDTQHRAELEKLHVEYTNCKLEMERLQRELAQQTDKNPVILEQIKTLEWQVEQKKGELRSYQEQMTLTEERHQTELASLKISLQDTQKELREVRSELAEFRGEKLAMQSKLSELRGALKAGLQQIKADEGEDSPAAKIHYDVSTIEKLLVDTSTPTHQSRTLTALQECLFGLRSNIGRLQKQMGEHTAAVQTSSQSWKEVEAQIKDLREVCRSSTETTSKPNSIINL